MTTENFTYYELNKVIDRITEQRDWYLINDGIDEYNQQEEIAELRYTY